MNDMGTTLGTLLNLAIYIGLVAVGAVIGSAGPSAAVPCPGWASCQFLALMILIVSLGVKLGANDEVISSLGQIGLAALLITVLAMAGSLLCLYLLRRFVFHLDRYGLPQGSAQETEETEGSGGKADNSLTKWIVLAVALGMLAGYFVIPDRMVAYCGRVIDFGLYLLLFLVGMDMGRQGTMLADIKAAGLKVLLVPVAVAAARWAAPPWPGSSFPLG